MRVRNFDCVVVQLVFCLDVFILTVVACKMCQFITYIWLYKPVAPQLLTTSNFIGPWYHAALLFSGLGSIVLLFGVLFSQQIREDLVKAATSPLQTVVIY